LLGELRTAKNTQDVKENLSFASWVFFVDGAESYTGRFLRQVLRKHLS
jgi:hypothetical protein